MVAEVEWGGLGQVGSVEQAYLLLFPLATQ